MKSETEPKKKKKWSETHLFKGVAAWLEKR